MFLELRLHLYLWSKSSNECQSMNNWNGKMQKSCCWNSHRNVDSRNSEHNSHETKSNSYFVDFVLSSLVCSLLLFSHTKHFGLFEIWSDHENTHDLWVSGQVSHSYCLQFEPVYDQFFAEFPRRNFEKQLNQYLLEFEFNEWALSLRVERHLQ